MNSAQTLPCPPNARILVRGVNWLGDAIMCTPALLRLREAYPGAVLALLTPAKLGDLWLHHPALDSILPFHPNESVFALARRLRREKFDASLILPNSFRSAFELWLARTPVRVGYAGQNRTWLLTAPVAARPGAIRMRKRTLAEIRRLIQDGRTIASSGGTGLEGSGAIGTEASDAHHIHQYLHLVRQLGADARPLSPQLFVEEREVEAWLRRFEIEPTLDRPLLGLNPGAEYGPAKRWPEENFILAASEVQRRARCRWVIFGGPAEVPLAGRIAAGILGTAAGQSGGKRTDSVINLAGATSLRELCAGLRACRVLLTNDTGPMHVAAAVGTPVVALFGSTSPELTGPGLPDRPPHRLLQASVPCAPCYLRECPIDFRCMRGISTDAVVEAVLERAREARL